MALVTDSSLGFLVAMVGRQAAAAFNATLASHGTHPRDYAVLRALGDRPGCSQREVADALGLPPSRIVGLLDGLQEAGAIEREPDPTDRRAHRVRLTDSGRGRLNSLQERADRLEAAIVADLAPAERDELQRLLGRVSAVLAREGSDATRLW